jgi:hypothetical protein
MRLRLSSATEINEAEAVLDGELYRTAPAVWQALDAQTAEFDVNADDDDSQNEFVVQYSFSIKAGNGKTWRWSKTTQVSALAVECRARRKCETVDSLSSDSLATRPNSVRISQN